MRDKNKALKTFHRPPNIVGVISHHKSAKNQAHKGQTPNFNNFTKNATK